MDEVSLPAATLRDGLLTLLACKVGMGAYQLPTATRIDMRLRQRSGSP